MLRSLIRSGVAALFVLSLSTPAQALPLAGEREDFTLSLSALWEHMISPVIALWTGGSGTCAPDSDSMDDGGGSTTETSGICDPNG